MVGVGYKAAESKLRDKELAFQKEKEETRKEELDRLLSLAEAKGQQETARPPTGDYAMYRVLKDPDNPSLGWADWAYLPKSAPQTPVHHSGSTSRQPAASVKNDISVHLTPAPEPTVAQPTYGMGRTLPPYQTLAQRADAERQERELARLSRPVIVVQPVLPWQSYGYVSPYYYGD
jgi:hypothetical protein